MDTPLISVIVPIFRVEQYLNQCVQSIVDQTYEELEIILVDDGSPDGCPGICDAWAEKDSRIRVIHKENGGLSDARNAGMAIATGDYIAFVDSDDTIKPDFLRELYQALTDSHADIAECAVSYVDENGGILRRRETSECACMDRLEALRRLVLEDGVYQTVWNKLYRRSVAEGIPFAVGKYNEDEFWTYQVFDRIGKLAIVNKPLYNYLQRGSSIIGVGFNIRRLDGLEGRYQRMEYLQKYEALAALTRQQFTFDCMWHLQSALRCLDGEEKERAVSIILDRVRAVSKVPQSKLVTNVKYRIWYALFTAAPVTTARLRNLLGVGV